MSATRPSGQFFVEQVGEPEPYGVPVDNFYWKTNRGCKVRLETTASRIYVSGDRKTLTFQSVPEALRAMADVLERKARNKE